MSDENKWIERRAHPRIARQFMARFRFKDSPGALWEVPTTKDISQGGCYFYTNIYCEEGQLLDIEVQFPRLKGPIYFTGKIVRVETFDSNLIARYGIGIQFVDMEETKKEKFVETLNSFLQQNKN